VELKKVLNAERLKQQNNIRQVRPLYLRHRRRQQFFLVLSLSVQTIAGASNHTNVNSFCSQPI